MERQLSLLQADTLFRFAQHAQRHPASAAGLQVTIVSCSGLKVADPGSARPYVHYQCPGHMQPVDTAIQPGPDPRFDESRTFEFAPEPQTSCLFLSKLGEQSLRLHVFDASNGGEHIGSVDVPLRYAGASLYLEITRHMLSITAGGEGGMGKKVVHAAWQSTPAPMRSHDGSGAA